MPTPTKPFKVLSTEKKSHRTKAELKKREEEEQSLSTDIELKERKEIKQNKIAHKEFKRIEKLLKNIDKNDAIYEAVINRYCLLQAECYDLEERREEFYKLVFELKEESKELTDKMDYDEDVMTYKLEYAKAIDKIMSSMLSIDKQIQSKRKMLLDIEKENVMTIASALRSIPKKQEKDDNPLLKVLRGEA
ncbi:MAG: hypothetical protein HFJ60_08860 [Clostridia bacterium]|nr:hypothetical protein [Clostridia bacterium]